MPQDQVVARTAPDGGATVERAPARRGELDLLRALVVVGLVFFHSAVIFGPGEFPVKAETEHLAATAFLAFGATWGMPLLFTISGMGVWYSLRSRGPAGFARERLRRLGVPLLVGLLTLVPLQVWLGLRHSGDPAAGPGFYRRFWDVRPSLNFPFVVEAAPGGLFETGHLWFLVCLLGFSLVLLPGLRLLDRAHGQGPAAVLFLVAGFLAAADRRIGQAFRRRRRAAIVLAGLGFLASGAVYAAASANGDPFTGMEPLAVAFRLLKTLDGLLWVVAILGLAGSRRARPRTPTAPARRVGAYLNEAVLPFYVLHETVVVAVAYAVLSWPVAPGVQYLVISLAALAGTLALYDLGVRRTPVTRALFGLKPHSA
jgi:glucan biosynthesis protein C